MFMRAIRDGSRVLPGQNAPRVNSPRSVASLSAKNEPKQLKMGPKEALQFMDAATSGEVASSGQLAAPECFAWSVSQWISEAGPRGTKRQGRRRHGAEKSERR